MTVYVVMTSNCGEHEGYRERIDSIWSTREKAVRRIERDMGMSLVQRRRPGVSYIRSDRWERDAPVLAEREPGESDEDWEDVLREYGDPPILWYDRRDAWIEERPLDGR